MNNQLWDEYNQHIKDCRQCKAEYDLREEGDINNCCETGLRIIIGLHNDLWTSLAKACEEANECHRDGG